MSFEAAADGVLEGALFAFVQGTNPEVLMPVPVTDRSSPYFFRWAAQPDRSAEVVVRPTAADRPLE